MLEYTVPALSCGHCARAVTEAVHEVDPGARVEVDLTAKQVRVETRESTERVQAALSEAGYPPAVP
ncbi:MAG: heavy-metal-associated domain-containing protein [Rubrivivax sp.]|nr:heavy-metal-associated domain-containing protein [Rubrivivax sp.]